ncbi:MAG TPA: hypothetical protein VER03_02285 [Bryobacteraceae bacterium]|nr:hypothetical protein [Bryobacteraceae bacterium]
MSQNRDNLIQHDDAPLADSGAPQTSNKTGLASSARKPSNSGPDSHSGKHKAPVAGAFGNDEKEADRNQTYIGDQAPAKKSGD